MQLQPGTLYVVGTPIGNLEDMTIRAVETLKAADLIAAEDTRHTGKLLHHFQIQTPQISYYEHNRRQRIPELLDRLLAGKIVAVVTDAGMPGISDPGGELVQACLEVGISVVPIPGVSACLTALSASGLASDRFVFEGFLPAKGKERLERLETLRSQVRTMIFYEAPHRLRQTLADLLTVLDRDRPVVVARELTKLHEEFWRGTLEAAAEYYAEREPKGELTVIVAGTHRESPPPSEQALRSELQHLLKQGLSRSQASRELAQKTALPRRQIYQLALTLPDEPPKM
jgi:16S rRNA (cytidine1402-2'-O)-methyltransferase